MFNPNDILARLQNGESADDIAQAMVKALNEANAQFIEAQEKEKEAARKAAEEQAAKAKKAEFGVRFIELMKDYINTYHPNSGIAASIAEDDGEVEQLANMLVEGIDEMVVEFDRMKAALAGIEDLLGKLDASESHARGNRRKARVMDEAAAMDPITDFLVKQGLI